MDPDISEFSYGFALVDELINRGGWPVRAVPVYPSLLAEGKLGYDVQLDRGGVPVFLQFKLSHCMVLRTAKEVAKGLVPPIYRFYLRPLSHSQQHNLLLKLEKEGNEVSYVAPRFHLPGELNDAWLNGQVANRSRFFRPSVIGKLPDLKQHSVGFNSSPGFVRCSEVQLLDGGLDGELYISRLEQLVQQRGETALTPKALHHLRDMMIENLPAKIDERTAKSDAFAGLSLKAENPLRQIAYLARTFYDSETLIVQKAD